MSESERRLVDSKNENHCKIFRKAMSKKGKFKINIESYFLFLDVSLYMHM